MIALPLPTFIPRYIPPLVPGEWFGHFAFTHDLLAELQPSLLVQLGTATGDSYFGFCQSVVEHGLGCLCYAIAASAEDGAQLAPHNASRYGSFSYLLDSGEEISSRFTEGSIDLLHVTSHVQWNLWLPKVRPGGFILLDGIAEKSTAHGLWELWEQTEDQFPDRFAFHHAGGLGILRKPGGEPLISGLWSAMTSGPADVREYVRRHYVIYSAYLERILQIDGATHALQLRLEELTTEFRAAQHERLFLESELTKTQLERNNARRTASQVQDSVAALQAASEAQLRTVQDREAQQLRTVQDREAQQQAEIERLTYLLKSERAVIQSLVQSVSWRVTAPMRFFMQRLRPRGRA